MDGDPRRVELPRGERDARGLRSLRRDDVGGIHVPRSHLPRPTARGLGLAADHEPVHPIHDPGRDQAGDDSSEHVGREAGLPIVPFEPFHDEPLGCGELRHAYGFCSLQGTISDGRLRSLSRGPSNTAR